MKLKMLCLQNNPAMTVDYVRKMFMKSIPRLPTDWPVTTSAKVGSADPPEAAQAERLGGVVRT
jgi:hypothetical protein